MFVKTLPQQVKKDITIKRNKHNVIEVDAPQGEIKVGFDRPTNHDFVDVRVMQKGKHKTLNVQLFNEKQQYIVGKYDLEILTLPRRYKTIKVDQSATREVVLKAPGTIKLKSFKAVTGQILEIKENNEFQWVCDLKENTKTNEWVLLPGDYKVVYRYKEQQSSSYTVSKDFKVYSNKTIIINL